MNQNAGLYEHVLFVNKLLFVVGLCCLFLSFIMPLTWESHLFCNQHMMQWKHTCHSTFVTVA